MKTRTFFIFLLCASICFGATPKEEVKSGTVLVEFVVGADVNPTKIKILKASNKAMAAAVVDAVSKWQLDVKFAGKTIRQPVEFRPDPEPAPKKKANQPPEPTAPSGRGSS
jgi:TonB family protein